MAIIRRKPVEEENLDEEAIRLALARIKAWSPDLGSPIGSEPLTWDDLVSRSTARAEAD